MKRAPRIATAMGYACQATFMHVPKQVQSKTLGRAMNFVSEVCLSVGTQPLNGMVSEQKACIVLLRPFRRMTVADAMKLPGIQVQPFCEVSFGQLQTSAVQTDETYLEAACIKAYRAITRQNTVVQ